MLLIKCLIIYSVNLRGDSSSIFTKYLEIFSKYHHHCKAHHTIFYQTQLQMDISMHLSSLELTKELVTIWLHALAHDIFTVQRHWQQLTHYHQHLARAEMFWNQVLHTCLKLFLLFSSWEIRVVTSKQTPDVLSIQIHSK